MSKGKVKVKVKGKLFLILGPSGSGKGVLIKGLRKNFKDFVYPISCTTREMRRGEKDGEVYFFISMDEFKKKIEKGDFLEWAVVHKDNLYGTLKSQIITPLKKGKNVLREVDIQGVNSIMKILPKQNIVTIFLTAESWNDLKVRITGRHKISKHELEKRKESFEKEMKFAKDCDYVVKSETGKIPQTIQKVTDIIQNELDSGV